MPTRPRRNAVPDGDVWDDLVARVGVGLAQQVRDIYMSGLRHATLERLADRMPDMPLGELRTIVRELQNVRGVIRSRQGQEASVSRAMQEILRAIRRR